ncbi:hypothetical protein ABBQ38_002299 [Trebouxia sp. C0009 RCD-2024]
MRLIMLCPLSTLEDTAKIMLGHPSIGYIPGETYKGRRRAGIVPVTLKDFRDGSKRQLHFSMVTPLSIYPDSRKGVLAALHYRNWQVISAAENIQTSNSKPSMWLIHKRQEDPAYCHALVRRWFWSFGDTIAEVTNGCMHRNVQGPARIYVYTDGLCHQSLDGAASLGQVFESREAGCVQSSP